MPRLTNLKPRLQVAARPRGWDQTSVGTTTERGYGWQWEKARRQALERDHGLCQPCAAAGRLTPATEVDHICSKAEGGGDNIENLQSICSPCHRAKTGAEAGRTRI